MKRDEIHQTIVEMTKTEALALLLGEGVAGANVVLRINESGVVYISWSKTEHVSP